MPFLLTIPAVGSSLGAYLEKIRAFPKLPAHPVVGVSADDAKAFCHWLTQKERDAHLIDETQAYRLPSDDEWTRAASTTKYPWGSAWPPPNNAGNFASEEAVAHLKMSDVIPDYRDGFAATSPVASCRQCL